MMEKITSVERIYVSRRLEPILGYISKNEGKIGLWLSWFKKNFVCTGPERRGLTAIFARE